MGKKTDKFIADLVDISNECTLAANKIKQLAPIMLDLSKQMVAVDAEYQRRSAEIRAVAGREGGVVGDGRGARREAAINEDPQIADINRRTEAMDGEWLRNLDVATGHKHELIAGLKKFNLKIAEFDKFVTAKANSWNPFKGKKSVPMARKFIVQARDYSSELAKLLEPTR